MCNGGVASPPARGVGAEVDAFILGLSIIVGVSSVQKLREYRLELPEVYLLIRPQARQSIGLFETPHHLHIVLDFFYRNAAI